MTVPHRMYIDISNAPIDVNDTLIVFDPDDGEVTYTLTVNKVRDVADGTAREFTCTVIDTTELKGNIKLGDVIPIVIERFTPTNGCVIKAIDNDDTLTPREKNGQIMANLVSFLNSKVDANYSATHRDVVVFLQTAGYFAKELSYEVCKRRLRDIQREFPEYIRLSGKWVSYTGKPFVIDVYKNSDKVAVDHRQKRIQWGKLVQGLRMCFEALGYHIDN